MINVNLVFTHFFHIASFIRDIILTLLSTILFLLYVIFIFDIIGFNF